MRQGQPNKRMRGRGRKGPNPLSRTYESNGPDVKIRGTAMHVAEKYVSLSRDAQATGDRIAAENYLQHAEHYFRIIAAAQAQFQPQVRDNDPQPVVVDMPRQSEDDQDAADQTADASEGEQPHVAVGESDDAGEAVASGDAGASDAGDGEEEDAKPRRRATRTPRAPRTPRTPRAPRTRRAPRAKAAAGEDGASRAPVPGEGEQPVIAEPATAGSTDDAA